MAIRSLSHSDVLDLIENEKSAKWVISAYEVQPLPDQAGIVCLVATNYKQKEETLKHFADSGNEIQKLLDAPGSYTYGVFSTENAIIAIAPFFIGFLVAAIIPGAAMLGAFLVFGGVGYAFYRQTVLYLEARARVEQASEGVDPETVVLAAKAVNNQNRYLYREVLKKKAKMGDAAAKKAVEKLSLFE